MDLALVRTGIAERLELIDGLRVFSHMPESAEPPCAVVGFPDEIDFDKAFARGLDAIPMIPVYVFVGRAHERTAQALLASYCNGSGSTSIKEAIEGDASLGGACDNARVVRAHGFRNYAIGAVEHLGCIFDVRVHG